MVEGKEGISRKNLIDLIFVFILAVSVLFMFGFVTAWTNNILSNLSQTGINYSTVIGVKINEDVGHVYNISINHTAGTNNITQINITLPAGFNFSLALYGVTTGSNGSGNLSDFSGNTHYALFFSNKTTSAGTILTWTATNDSAPPITTPYRNASAYIFEFNESLNSSFFWFNATINDPGIYNITVRIRYNMTAFYNETNITIYVNDTTNPNSVPLNISVYNSDNTRISNNTEGNYHNGTISMNISTVDSWAAVRSVFFNVTNASGYSNTSTFFKAKNSTADKYWNYTLDTSTLLPDGNYTVTVYANDTNGNLNKTARINLTIDNTLPSGSVSCTPATVMSGDPVTCSCSVTDATSGVNTSATDYTSGPSTTNTGTHTETCSFSDMAGNSGTASGTYVVELSGGGPSGRGPSTLSVITKTSSFSEITPEAPKIMSGFKAETGVKEIQIEVSETAQNVKVTVEKYESKPTEVLASKTGTYKYIYVKTQNLTDKLSKAKMTIQVEKSWISEKAITKEDMALFRYDENANKWNELTTSFKEESNNYYYYEIELNSFSYFAIAPKEGVLPEEEEEEIPTGGEEKGAISYWVWIVIGLIVLAVIIGLGVKLKKKK